MRHTQALSAVRRRAGVLALAALTALTAAVAEAEPPSDRQPAPAHDARGGARAGARPGTVISGAVTVTCRDGDGAAQPPVQATASVTVVPAAAAPAADARSSLDRDARAGVQRARGR